MIIDFKKYMAIDEQMLFIHFQNDDGSEQRTSIPFYHKKDEIAIEKKLEESINILPQLFEQVYNMGLNKEKVEFKYKEYSV
jgi:hypothetical protein